MSDINDCIPSQPSRKLAPGETATETFVRLSDKFLWEIAHHTAAISTEQPRTFLRLNFGLCHCMKAFRLNVDGFLLRRGCHKAIKAGGERERDETRQTVGKRPAALMTFCCMKIWWEFLAFNLYQKVNKTEQTQLDWWSRLKWCHSKMLINFQNTENVLIHHREARGECSFEWLKAIPENWVVTMFDYLGRVSRNESEIVRRNVGIDAAREFQPSGTSRKAWNSTLAQNEVTIIT